MSRLVERRLDQRRRCSTEHGIVFVRLRPGIDAVLTDICAGGALVETGHRLLPGRPIELHVHFPTQASTVKGRVLRCEVVRLASDRVTYQGVVGFDGLLRWQRDDDGLLSAICETPNGSTGNEWASTTQRSAGPETESRGFRPEH